MWCEAANGIGRGGSVIPSQPFFLAIDAASGHMVSHRAEPLAACASATYARILRHRPARETKTPPPLANRPAAHSPHVSCRGAISASTKTRLRRSSAPHSASRSLLAHSHHRIALPCPEDNVARLLLGTLRSARVDCPGRTGLFSVTDTDLAVEAGIRCMRYDFRAMAAWRLPP